ncbi:MAG: hypothetical protein OXL37_02500 [Chloroflexota bacterium]|nr:hypothetical protein [Chloroflexota bacterium]MDE2962254.1 hypothetical protein [Chloroflexota bacterium]
MTTPNPITELLAAMDNDPQLEEALRQRILTRELLELPQKLADLADMVARMAETFDRRLTLLEERVDGLADQQNSTNERLDRIDGRLDRIDGRLDRIEADQGVMRGQLNNLTGTDYERRTVRGASRIVRRYLGVRNAEVILAINRPDGLTIASLLNDSADRGIITEDDADELDRADIILRGSSPEGDDVYVVGEISITIDDSDVDRASDRARILQTASDTPTHAAVIGASISDANRERARSSNVTVVILNE